MGRTGEKKRPSNVAKWPFHHKMEVTGEIRLVEDFPTCHVLMTRDGFLVIPQKKEKQHPTIR